jgi:hypothetical protein
MVHNNPSNFWSSRRTPPDFGRGVMQKGEASAVWDFRSRRCAFQLHRIKAKKIAPQVRGNLENETVVCYALSRRRITMVARPQKKIRPIAAGSGITVIEAALTPIPLNNACWAEVNWSYV